MSEYIEPIKTAAIFFPFIALAISIPFVLMEYHRLGSASLRKALILYSFVLYFLCAYFLVILPLPTRSSVAAMTTPRCQWIPFRFLYDWARETPLRLTQPATWLRAFTDRSFLVPAYNVLLTLPFGLYLRYYYHVGYRRVLLCTFALSLFFELTQLSGLYFIYPRGYRLFDVDDLLLNTAGGWLGWFCAPLVMRILPSREALDRHSRAIGRKVSGRRRFTGLVLDLFLYMLLSGILEMLFAPRIGFKYLSIAAIVIYYILLPLCMHGSTLGERFLRLRVAASRHLAVQLPVRIALFLAFYLAVPAVLSFAAVQIAKMELPYRVREFVLIALLALLASYFLCIAVKYFFTNKPMLYETLSGTRMVSTTAPQEPELPQVQKQPEKVPAAPAQTASAVSADGK